jgi:hypothetical protein
MQINDANLHHAKVVGSCNPAEYKLFKGKEQIKLEVIII